MWLIPSRYSFHVVLLKPKPSLDIQTIRHRRDLRVKMRITLRSPSTSHKIPWDGVRLPYTYSVQNQMGDSPRQVLQLDVLVLATGSEETFREVCEKCKSREGKKKGADGCATGLIDFHSKNDVLDLHKGTATIEFKFLCDSKHHGRGSDAFRWVHILVFYSCSSDRL